jgi:hypothetical protein
MDQIEALSSSVIDDLSLLSLTITPQLSPWKASSEEHFNESEPSDFSEKSSINDLVRVF